MLYCLDFKQMLYRYVERFDEYILDQFISVRVAPELTWGEVGAAVNFFGKASSPFCIPVARQC